MAKWTIFFLLCVIGQGDLHAATPPCYDQVAVNFFSNQQLVAQALSLHRISQTSWAAIIRDLNIEVGKVPAIVRQRARQMQPNPFEPEYDAAKAQQLLMQTLYEVFANVLRRFGRGNPSDAQEMFQHIYDAQAAQISACLAGPPKRTAPQQINH